MSATKDLPDLSGNFTSVYAEFTECRVYHELADDHVAVRIRAELTHGSASHPCGLFRASAYAIARNNYVTPAEVKRAIGRLQELGFIDTDGEWVWVISKAWCGYSKSGDAQRSMWKQFASIGAPPRLMLAFIALYGDRLHLEKAAATNKAIRDNLIRALGASAPPCCFVNGPTNDGGGSDPGNRGVEPRSDPGQTPVRGGLDHGLEGGLARTREGGLARSSTSTSTSTEQDRSFGEEPRAYTHARATPPNERTPDEDGCPFTDTPHSTEDATPQPEPDEPTEPPRKPEQRAARVGAPAVGSPTFKDSRSVDRHPLAGMGSTRPPPPLVTLAEWQALPLDAKVKHVAYPAGCDVALREHVQAFDDAAQAVYEHHARAVEGAGLMPRGDGLDAARRAVVFLAAEAPTPVTPAEAAVRLMGLVDLAERKPDIVGKPLSGGVPAWVSADVLFGASASAAKFQPTAQRLPDNLNRAKAFAKVDDRVRVARLRVVRDDGPTPPPPGWTVEEVDAVDTYVVAKIGAKVRKEPFTPNPELEAREAALTAARAAAEGANAA